MTTPDLQQRWTDYKKKFNKTYEPDDDLKHLACFEKSEKIVEVHNKQGKQKYRMGINQFSDVDDEELNKGKYGGYYASKNLYSKKYYGDSTSSITPPHSIDWRDHGVVTPVKDQGNFPSCWAFSAIGALESAMKIHKGKKLIPLSAQQLVDCEQNNDDERGGNMTDAYKHIKQSHGIQSEIDYPYTATKGTCKFDKSNVAVEISGFEPVSTNEGELKKACGTKGPIAVGIEVTSNFRRYKGGIFDDKSNCTGEPKHAVLIVGYGTDGDQDYWIIKNSWGTTWGDSGYMKLARNCNNMCSIGSDGVYPVVA